MSCKDDDNVYTGTEGYQKPRHYATSIIVTTTSLIISCGARDGFIKETKFGDVIKIRNPRKKEAWKKRKEIK